MTELRGTHEDDLPRLAELEAELFGPAAWSPATLREELDLADRHYVVAVDGDLVVGYAGILLAPEANVMTVGVDPGHRRRGIATAMLEELLAAARQARCRQVFLEVRADDAGAQRLYRRAGFEDLGIRRGYYQPGGHDALVMVLELRQRGRAIGARVPR